MDWPGRPFLYSNRPEKHKLGRGRWDLASCQVSLNSVQQFKSKCWKCLSQWETRVAIFFLIGPKNTNLVDDVEILLPVKFRWISFRGEVENVSVNQRPGWPSFFPYRSEKHKLGRGRWDLASCQVSLNSVQQFLKEEMLKMSQPIWETQCGHLLFLIRLKNTNLVEDVEILLPVKFRWISFSSFWGEVKANQKPGRPSCFSNQPEKHRLGRGR